MTVNDSPPFGQQRLIAIALLAGAAMFAIVVAVLLQTRDGKGMAPEPIPQLDTVVVVVGVTMALGAVVLRSVLRSVAEKADAEERTMARFRATLVPIVLLEGASMLALTDWMLSGRPVPGLVVAMVALAIGIAMVPFTDPDAGR